MSELDETQRRMIWTVYATPLITSTTGVCRSICFCMFRYVRLVTGTSSQVPWNGLGRRMVELTEACCSERDSQGLTR